MFSEKGFSCTRQVPDGILDVEACYAGEFAFGGCLLQLAWKRVYGHLLLWPWRSPSSLKNWRVLIEMKLDAGGCYIISCFRVIAFHRTEVCE